MRRHWLSGFVATILLLGAMSANAAPIEFVGLDIPQGINFAKDNQNSFGYVTALKVGSASPGGVTADLSVTPGGQTNFPKVIGVISDVSWAGGHGDRMAFQVAISTANRQRLAAMLHKNLTDTSVELAFVVYSYDPAKRNWYVSFASSGNDTLKGLVAKDGAKLAIAVGEKNADVAAPELWNLSFSVMPKPMKQSINFCVGDQRCAIKTWGVAVN